MKITELKPEDVGRWVQYKPMFIGIPERGRIKSWNDKNVFVVYKCDNNWDRFAEYTGCSTDPDALTFV